MFNTHHRRHRCDTCHWTSSHNVRILQECLIYRFYRHFYLYYTFLCRGYNSNIDYTETIDYDNDDYDANDAAADATVTVTVTAIATTATGKNCDRETLWVDSFTTTVIILTTHSDMLYYSDKSNTVFRRYFSVYNNHVPWLWLCLGSAEIRR